LAIIMIEVRASNDGPAGMLSIESRGSRATGFWRRQLWVDDLASSTYG
jgi:hypothetical protein